MIAKDGAVGVVASESRWLILSCGSRIDGSPFDPSELGQQLARSLEEGLTVISPSRIVVVALESESPWWAPEVAGLPEENVLEQPIDRGSATGVLLAFLRIFRSDPRAEVIVASVDARPGAIVTAAAMRVGMRGDDRVLMGLRSAGQLAVCRASSSAFLRLFREAQPGLLATAIDHLRHERPLDELYPFLPAVDLERDVFGLVPDSVRRASSPVFAHA